MESCFLFILVIKPYLANNLKCITSSIVTRRYYLLTNAIGFSIAWLFTVCTSGFEHN